MNHARTLSNRLVRPFRRISASGAWFPEVDGLRFLSILVVMLSHTFIAWRRHNGFDESTFAAWPNALLLFLNNGHTGVLIFFVISGYIIALPFAKAIPKGHDLNLKNYYLRRLVRIEPPYLIIMTGFFLVYALTGWQHVVHYGPHYAASIFYLHNVIFPYTPGLNDVAWSLEVEIQFYLLAPLFFRVYRLPAPARRMVLCAFAIVGLALPLLWCPDIVTLYHYFEYFACGMLLADIVQHGRPLTRAQSSMLNVAALLSFFLLFFGSFISQPARDWLTPLFIFIITAAALLSPRAKQVFGIGILPVIGGMCYSIYLVHNLLLVFLFKYGMGVLPGNAGIPAFLLNALLMSACVLLVSAVVFRLVERPFMKYSSRYPLWEK